MADDFVKALLTKWGLPESIEEFASNKITKEAMPLLTVESITKLIPLIGPQVIFLKEWTNMFQNSSQSTNIQSENPTPRPMEIDSARQNFNIRFLPSIEAMLRKNIQTSTILATYKKSSNPKLTKRNQTIIVDQIITTVLNESTKRLKNTDFAYLGAEIVKVFPTEEVSTYYVQAVKKKDSRKNVYMPARGKLINKYKNSMSDLKQLEESLQSEQDIDDESNADPDLCASKKWLALNMAPWDIILQHWDISFPLRRQEVLAVNTDNFNDFFKQWMPFKHPNGYQLINADFLSLNLTEKIVNAKDWDSFFTVISKECQLQTKDLTGLSLKTYLSEENEKYLTEDSKTAIQMLLLPHFIPPQTLLKSSKKKSWRPSIANAKDSLIVHVKLSSDVTDTRDKRIKWLKTQNLSFQPQIIIVGTEITKITDSYVCIDNIIFKVNSTFEAIDICFKVFHVLNVEYSLESEHIWLLLQKGLYQFSTKWDKTISYTARLLKILNDQKEKGHQQESQEQDQLHNESNA